MQQWLGIIHGLDYVSVHLLLGTLFFRYLILTAGGVPALDLDTNFQQRARVLIGFTIFSSTVWMLSTAADMADSWTFEDLWQGMSHTDFGHFWCIRILLLVLGLILTIRCFKVSVLLLLTIVLLLTSSLTGHAGASTSERILRVFIDWLHSIAVGVWTGGLFSLLIWLKIRISKISCETNLTHKVVKRFSHFAMASTGIIAVTGIIMAFFAGIPLRHPWTSTYGVLVLSKIAFFSIALLAASVNQFYHLRRYDFHTEQAFANGIRREVTLELFLVLIIFGIAGFLARTASPVG